MGDTLARTVLELRDELENGEPCPARPRLLTTLVQLAEAQVQLEDKTPSSGVHSLCLLERELDMLEVRVHEELRHAG
jgi:hypothetical protein